MTHYFLHVKTFSRGAGSSVTKAAAYRAGERIKDERLGAVYDYRDRTDVAHAEILLPSELEGDADTDWARDRSVLWNAVQGSGRQKNSRLGAGSVGAAAPRIDAESANRLGSALLTGTLGSLR